MDPKMHQNRAPETPKTLLEPGCRWKLVSEPFWALFGTPRDPENRALAVARCYFCQFCVTRPGTRNRPPNGPKIEPKTTPGGPRMARNVAPNRCSNFDQISTPILTIWELQNGTPNHSKISLRAQGPPRARPGPAQRPPESLSGGILGSFWLQFGPSGGSCSSFFGVHVCFFWLAACLLLVLFFSCVLSSAARLLSYQATRHRSPKR